ncbi:MAG: GNAT family N-acetyltransferase [Ignavibacteriales bacterium]
MIRKLKPEDRCQLEKILQSIDQFNEQEVGTAMELIDVALMSPAQEDYYIYVCEDKGNAVGYHCTGRRPLTDGVFDLYWIVVDPAAQGMGIGRQLLKHSEDLVEEKNGRWLLAETSSKDSYQATRNFYHRSGYSILAQIKDFYAINDSLIIFGKYFKQK